MKFMLFVYIPLIGAGMYGMYGGGFYQFLKHWKLANGREFLLRGKPVRGWHCVVGAFAVSGLLMMIMIIGALSQTAAQGPSLGRTEWTPPQDENMAQSQPATAKSGSPPRQGTVPGDVRNEEAIQRERMLAEMARPERIKNQMEKSLRAKGYDFFASGDSDSSFCELQNSIWGCRKFA